MSKNILLLGGSGSIGTQTIDLCQEFEQEFHIVSLTLKSHTDVLENYLGKLKYLKTVGIKDAKKAEEFHKKHPGYMVISGSEVSARLAREGNYDKAVNALVGAEGFVPSLEVLKANKDLCLANKESLVIGGKFLKDEIKAGHGRLFPIDSEHVALAKLFKNADRSEIKKVIITASGGSLRDIPIADFSKITVKEALNHPTWKMGARITIDSATMVNKGFEFIEAGYLYDWPIDKIDVLVNDESHVHSALEFADHSYLFEVGPSDMKVPISYALHEGHRVEAGYKSVDFNCRCSLNFRKFEAERYPLFSLVLNTFRLGGTSMAFFNAVDEEAISRFTQGKLTFLEMTDFIREMVLNHIISIDNPTADDVLKTDKKARDLVKELLG